MSRASRAYRRIRSLHKWFSIVLALFILVFAVSGIVMNHRDWVSSIDVHRNLLPESYRYNNWNLAAVRGSMPVGNDSSLIWGNVGVWLLTGDSAFSDFNRGFPEGIDNRKISKIIQTPDGEIYAATFFGLYRLSDQTWHEINLPVSEKRITDLFMAEGKLHVLTRSHLFEKSEAGFTLIRLPQAEDEDGKAGLFETLWMIHSGEIWGTAGKLFVDFIGLVFMFLTLTGLLLWLFPGLIRKLKRRGARVKSLAGSMKFSLKWHNRLGYYLTVFLVLTTLTGMFLRPPLLIPIAGSRVAKIPFTTLDHSNTWHDELRAAMYDDSRQRYVFSTSEGFYFAEDFRSPLQKFEFQPPVSVMGINVFEQLPHGGFLVGSFSGLYSWFPEQQFAENVITREVYMPVSGGGRPFADNAIAGMVWDNRGNPYLFDYAAGAYPFMHQKPFPAMPREMIANSPLSLWNLALEFHTARIYSAILGDFYILIVPLVGLSLLFVVISGFWMYRVKFRRTSGNHVLSLGGKRRKA